MTSHSFVSAKDSEESALAYGSELIGTARGERIREIWILLLCLNYFCFALIITFILDRPAPSVPPYFAASFINAFLPIGAITMLFIALRPLSTRFAGNEITGTLGPALRKLGWGFLVAVSMLLFLGAFSTWKNAMSVVSNFTWDERLADLDAALHLGNEPWWLYVPIVKIIPLTMLEIVYMRVWIALAGALPMIVLLLERDPFERRRFFICFFAIWIVLGNVTAIAFLSGGPIYFNPLTGDERFQPLIEWLQNHSAVIPLTIQVQDALWQAQVAGEPFLGSGISAFPSVHVGMATLTALYLIRRLGSIGGALGLSYLFLIQVGSVVFAWHYAIDGYFSIILVWIAWRLASPTSPSRRIINVPTSSAQN